MTRTPTKIFKGKIYGSQLVGKPNDRWIHEVTSEARKMLGGSQDIKDWHWKGKCGYEG